jgi:hypothetical protein
MPRVRAILTLLVIFGPRGSEALTRARLTATTRKKDKKRFLKLVIVHNFPIAPNMVGEGWLKIRRSPRAQIAEDSLPYQWTED